MRSWSEILLDEKIILCGMTMFCSAIILTLVHWHAEKEIVMAFLTLAGGFAGALARGITHQDKETSSTQKVSSSQTVMSK